MRRVVRDETFDEGVFDRAARAIEPADDELEFGEAPSSREGLPSSYRMRHDPHYVEQIAARPRPSIPVAAFSELTEHLGAIGACLRLFGDRDRPLRERVAIGLAQAEVQRGVWLSQALAVLAGDPPVAWNRVEISSLVRRVAAAFDTERVFGGSETECDCEEALPAVSGDEQLLAIALAGVISAVYAVVERERSARVRVQAAAFRGEVRLTVRQDVVSLPPALRTRFFDLSWPERPGGVAIGVRLAAARRIAELHGGKVHLAAADRGCALALSLPVTEE